MALAPDGQTLAIAGFHEVVLHRAADAEALRAAGLTHTVRIPDLTRREPGFWVRHRRWLTIAIALLLAWLVVESALAWNFFEG